MSPRSQLPPGRMTRTSLDAWLQRLETLHPTAIDMGLERVAMVAARLALLPVTVPVVTVAGTNGKGSAVAVVDGLLRQAGYSTGSFTSPHLLRFNERIRVDGVDVEDAEITAAFAEIEAARGDVSLTYFEFAALAALCVFRSRQPDFVILEVGLGGRLDAVNIIDPTVAVITSIDLDHQQWLGETRDLIALEKAGILRAGVPAVIGDVDPPPALLEHIERVQAEPVMLMQRDMRLSRKPDHWLIALRDVSGQQREFALKCPRSLVPETVCAALQSVLLLGVDIDPAALPEVLKAAAPRGRREHLELAGVDYVLDVAHNPAAVAKLLEYINTTPCKGRRIAVFSAMRDKDIPSMIEQAATSFDAWFLADQPGNSRAAPAADIAGLLRARGVSQLSCSKNLKQAMARVRQVVRPGDSVIVFGSFYTLAAVLPWLDRASSLNEAQ